MYQPHCRTDLRSSWPIETELFFFVLFGHFFCLISLLIVYLDFCFCEFCFYFIFLKEKEKNIKLGGQRGWGDLGRVGGRKKHYKSILYKCFKIKIY